jgi:hypothetical protein
MNIQNKSFWPENTLLSKSFHNGCSSAGISGFGQEKFETAVFQNRRWDNDFKTVQKIISEKVLGDISGSRIPF